MTGYYRFPTINNSKIVFVSDDDLWITDLNDLRAFRLTNHFSEVSSPLLSPDGKNVAFIGTEDGGTEIYVVPSNGGISKRLTFDGALIKKISSWNDNDIIFSTNSTLPFPRSCGLASVNIKGGITNLLKYGTCNEISYGHKVIVLGKNTADPARWKRYKGGLAGEIWISKNNNNFKKLISLNGNMACPLCIEKRVYFISDHDGISNIYSCLHNGKDLQQHTFHNSYYVRNATSDKKTIVYQCGADIFSYDITSGETKLLNIDFNSSMVQRTRKFVDPMEYLEDININKKGNKISFISRGKSFVMENWNGPVYQQGKEQGVRYQKTRFLNNGNKVVLVSDEDKIEKIEIYTINKKKKNKTIELNIGRPYDIKVSPVSDHILVSNHKNELLLVDINDNSILNIDKSKFDLIGSNFDWSPDGKYIAYSCSYNSEQYGIKIYDIINKKKYNVSNPILSDRCPKFDPTGKYLAFISKRIFNPIHDNMHFDISFPFGEKPYIITLDKTIDSPFYESKQKEHKKKKKEEEEKIIVKIDFENIDKRIIPVPTNESIFTDLGFVKDKLFYGVSEINKLKDDNPWDEKKSTPRIELAFYDFSSNTEEVFMDNIKKFVTHSDSDSILIQSNNNIRLLSTKNKPTQDELSDSNYNSKSGKIDLDRARISIEPIDEWKQMYSEAWRLQKYFFWNKKMSGVNWNKVYNQYYSLIDRVSTRSEFSDLIWEMQGELGTSHCYELGGDYQPRRNYNIGFIGADLEYDEKARAYKIINLVEGDRWSGRITSPLVRPGINIENGIHINKISGNKLTKKISPNKFLVNQVNKNIELNVTYKNGKKKDIVVKTVPHLDEMRYRDWVEKNRKYVHRKTKNKVGYVHIPDMGPHGYSEFHRYWLSELQFDSLIVDVRFNGGGFVSQLILEKLARKRIGYDKTRWMGIESYPSGSFVGPMLALTNEYAGSDGDIFSHSFKLMELGKLIGKRTWGGVIGIWPRNLLVDGTMTTQPEFSFWFKDVGWKVENYGADVDIEVDITPQDYSKGVDTQLDRGIKEILKELNKNPINKPDLTKNKI